MDASNGMQRAAIGLLLTISFVFLFQLGALVANAVALDTGGGSPPTGVVGADPLSDAVAATAASFRVDESGAATYSIPLYAVPGTAGVSPKLSLEYSSQAAAGVMGKGWRIGGTSSITRCRATREAGDFISGGQPVDGAVSPVNFTATDRFCLDGQRLIAYASADSACPAAAGMSGVGYRTEIESFQRVCGYDSGDGLGPKFFTVERKDGSISWYGDRSTNAAADRSDGYVNSTAPGKEGAALAWAQTRFQDSTGNYIDYLYSEGLDGAVGEHLLAEVRFTGKVVLPGQSGTAKAPYARIVFGYAALPASRVSKGYQAGGLITQAHILQSISSLGPSDEAARYYELAYAASASGSGMDVLASVQECRSASKAVCAAATQFTWSESKHELATSQAWNPGYFGSATKFEGFKLGDIDGDGRPDMVWLKDGASGETCPTEHIMVSFGELDAYGRQSFSAGVFTGCTPTELQTSLGEASWQLFDYTGDGRDDLFVAGGGAWMLYPSQGRTSQPINTANNLLASIYIPMQYTPTGGIHPQLTDLNGDGLFDVIYQNSGLRVRLMERGGSGFAWGAERAVTFVPEPPPPCPPEAIDGECHVGPPQLYDPERFRLNDFNGDAASDLVFIVTLGWREYCDDPWCDKPVVHASQPNKYAYGVSQITPAGVEFKRQTRVLPDMFWNAKPLLGDINGDGLTDLVYQSSAYARFHYALNTGTGFLPSVEIGALPRPELAKLIDINGDGRADLVFAGDDTNGWRRYFVRYALAGGGFTGDQRIPGDWAVPCLGVGCDPNEFANMFTDLDGDGGLDYFALQIDNDPAFYLSQPGAASRFKPRDVIVAITNGLGSRTEIGYAALTNSAVHRRDFGSRDSLNWGRGSPVVDVVAPTYVVSKAASSSPQPGDPNAMATLYYRYAGAKVQSGGRGFLGFREIDTIDPNHAGNYVVTSSFYSQNFPYTGMPARTTKSAVLGQAYVTDACQNGVVGNGCYATPGQGFAPLGGSWFSDDWQSYETAPAFSAGVQEPLHVRTSGSDEKLRDPYTGAQTSRVATAFVYGAYGNVVNTAVDTYTGASATAESTVSTSNSYADSPALWRLGRLAASTVTHHRPGVSDVVRTASFAYAMSGPATGLLLQERTQPGGGAGMDISKTYTLDEYGNRTAVATCSQASPACGPAGLQFHPTDSAAINRYSKVVYDDNGRFATNVREPFLTSTGVVEAVTQTVLERNVFGDIENALDINGVRSFAVSGGLGRPYYAWKQTTPDAFPGSGGAATITTYRFCGQVACPTGAKFRQRIVGSGTPTRWTYFDMLGRPIMAAAETFNAGMAGKEVSATCTEYDATGKARRSSNPFFLADGASNDLSGLSAAACQGATHWTVTDYDLLGRVTRVTAPDGTHVDSTYNGLTTVVTDARSHSTTQVRNGKGEVVSVTDANGLVLQNIYDAAGNLAAIRRDVGAGLISNDFAYDALGRKILQIDPDTGETQYTYNAAGEIIAQQDAAGQRVENEYDARGRLWRKTVRKADATVESQTTYTYDTAAYGLGQLASEATTGKYSQWANPSGKELSFAKSYVYDSLGRPSSVQTSIDSTPYGSAVQYDALGRPFKNQDASGRWSKTEFDSTGRAAAICESDVNDSYYGCGTLFYQRTQETDAFGHVIKEVRSGTGAMQVANTYSAITGRIERICAGSACQLVDEAYAWDAAGNLSTHQKESRYLETFTYDSLNRLLEGKLAMQDGVAVNTVLQSFGYDLLGNVCSKNGVGFGYGGNDGCATAGASADENPPPPLPPECHYTPSGIIECEGAPPIEDPVDPPDDPPVEGFAAMLTMSAGRPHAVNRTVNGTAETIYSYDARGNQIYRNAPGTATDRVIRYSIDNYPYEVTVGGGMGSRTEFWYAGDGTRYKRRDDNVQTLYVGNVEIVSTGSGVLFKRYIAGVVVQSIAGSTTSDQYLFNDHLGSVVRITDAAGQALSGMDYSAFGSRRDYDTPSSPGAGTAITNRGFTGHEHVAGKDVIHMNGRIYDPELGRFLQADPMIQSPGDAQSWNAYTYVFNNPLAYTDPTGLWGIKEQNALRMVAAIVISIWTGGAASTLAAQGATSAAFGVAMAGGFAAGVIASNGSLRSGVIGAFGAALTLGITRAGFDYWQAVGAQAMTGGIMESLQGGNFGSGFISAGLTAAVMPHVGKISNDVLRTTVGAIVGGTISDATGGKFANGAITGAIQAALTHPGSRLRSMGGDSPADPAVAAAAAKEANAVLEDSGIYDRIGAAEYRSERALARDWGKAVYPVTKKYGVELGVRIYRGRGGQFALGPTGSSGAYDWVDVSVLPNLSVGNYSFTAIAHTHPAVAFGNYLSMSNHVIGGTRIDGSFYMTSSGDWWGDIPWAINNEMNIHVYGGSPASLTSWSYSDFVQSHSSPGSIDYVCATTVPRQC